MSLVIRNVAFFLLLQVLVSIFACSSSTQSNLGVVRIYESQIDTISEKSPEVDIDISLAMPTDEDITIQFTMCMRNHGFDIPDPTVNADGTVDWLVLKENMVQDPNYSIASKTKGALDECLQLLEGITFNNKGLKEDPIELQDNLLRFSRCLRDNGVDLADPVFGEKPRESMKSMLVTAKGTNRKVQKAVDLCREAVFISGK